MPSKRIRIPDPSRDKEYMVALKDLEQMKDQDQAVRILNKQIKRVEMSVRKAVEEGQDLDTYGNIQPALIWLGDAHMTIGSMIAKSGIKEVSMVRRGHVYYVLRDSKGKFLAFR